MNWGSDRFWNRVILWVAIMIGLSIAINFIMRGGIPGIITGMTLIIGGCLFYLNKDQIKTWFARIRDPQYVPPATTKREKRAKQKPNHVENQKPLSKYEENIWNDIINDMGKDK